MTMRQRQEGRGPRSWKGTGTGSPRASEGTRACLCFGPLASRTGGASTLSPHSSVWRLVPGASGSHRSYAPPPAPAPSCVSSPGNSSNTSSGVTASTSDVTMAPLNRSCQVTPARPPFGRISGSFLGLVTHVFQQLPTRSCWEPPALSCSPRAALQSGCARRSWALAGGRGHPAEGSSRSTWEP